jgi:hypothetical protein
MDLYIINLAAGSQFRDWRKAGEAHSAPFCVLISLKRRVRADRSAAKTQYLVVTQYLALYSSWLVI